MSKTTKIRVGVIGAGRMGGLHAHNLAQRVPGAELAVVADLDPGDAAARLAEPLGAQWTRDIGSVLNDASIQAVVIATPTPTHVDLVTAAAQARKHIFCEKPVAMDIARMDQALKAVRDGDVQLQVGFHRRFDPSMARARQTIEAGHLGKPVILTLQSCDAGIPPLAYLKTSGGVFRDMMIHDFDVARWLAGQEVVEVMALGGCLIEPAIAEMGDADTVVVTLRFADGALGVLRGCRNNATGHDVRAEVLLTKGSVAVQNPPLTVVEVGSATGVATDRWYGGFVDRFADAYVAEMRAFIGALGSRTAVPVPGEAARAALQLATAAGRSLAENRPVAVER